MNILLENKSDFEYYFEKLSDSERESFIEYPIYNMINNAVQNIKVEKEI